MNARRARSPYALLFAALCLPAPRPLVLEPVTSSAPMTAAAWESSGDLGRGVTVSYSSQPPYGAQLTLDAPTGAHGPAGLRLTRRFGFAAGTLRGLYRMSKPLPYAVSVVLELFGPSGRGATRASVEYFLEAASDWRYFEIPVRNAAGGSYSESAVRIELKPGVAGLVTFASLAFLPGNEQRLVACGELRPFTRAGAPAELAPSPFARLQQSESGWWFVGPTGKGVFSLGIERDPGGLATATFNSRGGELTASAATATAKPTWAFLDNDTSHWGAGADDPYDPRFSELYARQAAAVGQYATATWIAGTFADEAFDFGNLGSRLWLPAAGKALIQRLKTRYPTIRALNDAWGTSYSSFDELAAAKPALEAATGPMARDLGGFARDFVARFVGLTTQLLRAGDPSHLVFSPRLRLAPGLAAAVPYLDLFSAYDAVSVSFTTSNLAAGLAAGEKATLELIARSTGRPLLINRLVLGDVVAGAPARAQQARDVLTELYNLPFVVGIHWAPLPSAPELLAAIAAFNSQVWQPDFVAPTTVAAPVAPKPDENAPTGLWMSGTKKSVR